MLELKSPWSRRSRGYKLTGETMPILRQCHVTEILQVHAAHVIIWNAAKSKPEPNLPTDPSTELSSTFDPISRLRYMVAFDTTDADVDDYTQEITQ